jgi:hypothetical protein
VRSDRGHRVTVENEDRTTDDDDAWVDLFAEDDDVGSPVPVTTLLGAIGQFVAAVLAVAVLVALFIGGAIVVRWIFG